MATATKTQTLDTARGKHRPLLPYVPVRNNVPGEEDRTQALWPWYFLPFPQMRVSPECEAFIMGEYVPDDEEERAILRSELIDAPTVRATANDCIIQAPGAASAVRQDYYSKGFRAVSPVTGEASGGPPLQMYEPQLESGFGIGHQQTDSYIGINDIIKELDRRMKWSLAQLDAKIEDAVERTKEGDGQNKRYMRAAVSSLRRRRAAVANGVPTAKELQLFFKRFELQRLESREDQHLKEQQALQGRINDQNMAIARLASEVSADVWGAAEELPA